MKEVFAQVTTARQNRDKLINDALSEENRILSQAGASASSVTNAAESARTRFVTSIQSDAEAFKALLPKYAGNPQLYAQLELTKVMAEVLTNVQDKMFVSDSPDGKPRELRLLLNREIPKPKAE